MDSDEKIRRRNTVTLIGEMGKRSVDVYSRAPSTAARLTTALRYYCQHPFGRTTRAQLADKTIP